MNNVQKGEQFKILTAKLLSEYFEADYRLEIPFSLGNTLKQHKVDIAFPDKKIIVECKAYTYTASGNNPSAKISTFIEAVNYMNKLPLGYVKIIALKRATHPSKRESLAEYIVRTKKVMLGDVHVVEVDENTNRISFLTGKLD